MLALIKDYFTPPDLTSYESQQRQRTLSVVIWVTMAGAVGAGVVNIFLRAGWAALVLFALAGICIWALYLNRQRRYTLASSLISIGVLLAANFNLYDGGGLHDPGIVAYPIFVVLGSMLFGKRAAPVFAVAAIFSLSLIAYIEINAIITVPQVADIDDLITIIILLVTGAIIIWVVMNNIEKNLARVKRSEAAVLDAYEHTLEGWALALEYRDRETEGHSRRVTELTVKLAEKFAFTDREMIDIRRGALLHDIGKLAVPDQILFKPAALDTHEMALIRKHPVYARKMLARISFLQSALDIPYCHHENWDGSGYPRGLKGKDIPLSARLFAVVDNWEALNSDRPYRKAWPRAAITAYFKKEAGRMFDPEVVDAFLEII